MTSKEITGIIQTYNDFEGVERLHRELEKHEIFSIWGDGRFPDFEKTNNSDISSDGTRDYLLAQNDTKVMYYPNMYEYDKLTKLLHTAGKMGFKYAILFGCDEYPIGDFKELIKNLEQEKNEPAVYRLRFTKETKKDDVTHSPDFVERVFRYPERISVKTTHWSYHIDENPEVNISNKKIIEGIIIHHDQSIRPKVREHQMLEYQIKQVGIEKADFFARVIGIDSKPTISGLEKLFPNNKVVEYERYFSIVGKPDAKKLIFKWIRWREPDELCVKK